MESPSSFLKPTAITPENNLVQLLNRTNLKTTLQNQTSYISLRSKYVATVMLAVKVLEEVYLSEFM